MAMIAVMHHFHEAPAWDASGAVVVQKNVACVFALASTSVATNFVTMPVRDSAGNRWPP